LPDRLSYPELMPEEYHARCLYGDEGELLERLRRWARDPAAARAVDLRGAMRRFGWETVAPDLDGALERAARAGHPR